MNEFEIKTAKQNLKDLGLIEIYKVSEEYNLEEYGSQEIDVVLEYSYKEEVYYTHCIFYNEELKKHKLENVKKALQNHLLLVEDLIYKENGAFTTNYINNFIESQKDLIIASKEKKRYSRDFSDVDMIWEKIIEGKNNKLSKLEIYKQAMEVAKKEAGINE